MGRSPCCSKEGMNRGAWTALEDQILKDYIKAHGEGRWRNLPNNAGLKRCGKSCRLRWLNYLRPDIKRGNISLDEEDLIIRLHKLLGNRWSLIAGRLPGRTDNEIKNYWNTNLVKRVQFDPNHHHHHKSPPDSDHSNHNHRYSNNDKKENKPSLDPPPNNEQPLVVHTMALRSTKPTTTTTHITNNPAPENFYCYDHVPMLRDMSVDDLVDYGCEDGVAENFMMNDLTIGDLQLSDLLNSEFSDLGGFRYTQNNNVDDNNPLLSPAMLPPSSDHLAGLVFCNEMLEDWALCDQNVAANDLNSFSLDNEEGDWL